jgi:hypothetical protein
MKTRDFFGMLFFSVATIVPATAGGSSAAHMYPEATESAWQGAFNAPNENYGGEAKSYANVVNNEYELSSYSLIVKYKDLAKPYVISKEELEDNSNYYYGPASGKDRDTFLGFETGSSTHSFPLKYLHQFAFPTPTKNTSTTNTIPGGKIRIYYTPVGADKETFVDIPVTIELRDCEAYGKDMWIQSGEGWIGK